MLHHCVRLAKGTRDEGWTCTGATVWQLKDGRTALPLIIVGGGGIRGGGEKWSERVSDGAKGDWVRERASLLVVSLNVVRANNIWADRRRLHSKMTRNKEEHLFFFFLFFLVSCTFYLCSSIRSRLLMYGKVKLGGEGWRVADCDNDTRWRIFRGLRVGVECDDTN